LCANLASGLNSNDADAYLRVEAKLFRAWQGMEISRCLVRISPEAICTQSQVKQILASKKLFLAYCVRLRPNFGIRSSLVSFVSLLIDCLNPERFFCYNFEKSCFFCAHFCFIFIFNIVIAQQVEKSMHYIQSNFLIEFSTIFFDK
jgi:hypothetical protein